MYNINWANQYEVIQHKCLYTDGPLLWEMLGKFSFFLDIFQQKSFLQQAIRSYSACIFSVQPTKIRWN